MNAISSVKIGGTADILGTLQLAQLALKHKQNKSQQQRIILFVGSPVSAKTEDLVRIAKRLKKNNTAVDVISFGETIENAEKLQAFHDAVNNNDNSALLSVPPGPHNLSDFLNSFPSVLSSGSSGSSEGGFLGVDPQMDPELAAALRMSIEDQQQQQGSQPSSSEGSSGATEGTEPTDMEMDEDMLLQKALEMSMMQDSADSAESEAKTEEQEAPVPEAMEFDDDDDADDAGLYDDLDEEAQLALAMQISMGGAESNQEDKTESKEETVEKDDPSAAVQDALNDPSFMDSIFDNIEGVDANDPLIQSTLRDLNKDSEKDKKDSQ